MRPALALAILLAPVPAAAQRLGYEDVLSAAPRLGYQRVQVAEAPAPPPPPLAVVAQATERAPIAQFYGDRMEIVPEGDSYSWDLTAEIGNGAHRLWLAASGDGLMGGGFDYVETQALYSHPIAGSGLAVQAGVRRDFVRPRRAYAALGVQGNLTEPLFVGAFGFLSTKSELTGRLFAYYDWEPVRNLVFQPYAGLELAASDMPALGVGRGVTELELSARLRYRIAEPFAPYVGISYGRLLGRTARLARLAGDEAGTTSLVLGIRSYF